MAEIKKFSEKYWEDETRQNIENDVAELLTQRDELLQLLKIAATRIMLANEEGNGILRMWLFDTKEAFAKAEGTEK